MSNDIPLREQLSAIRDVISYNPLVAFAIVSLSLITAVLEGISVTFLVPIIESTQQTGSGAGSGSRLASLFIQAYEFFGLPFTLETIIGGVATIITLRYVLGFFSMWFVQILRTNYVRHVQTMAFENALDARIPFYDRRGSDEILNAIVTQSKYAGDVIQRIVQLLQNSLTSLMYAGVTFYLAPTLTVVSAIVLGLLAFVIRGVFESGYSIGDRVAMANERIQTSVQAGTQGIRDVKLFCLRNKVFADFRSAVDEYAASRIKLQRNKAGMNSIYQLVTALSVFVLIYFAVRFTPLTIAELGTFLFAMFRLAPRISAINNQFYDIQGNLPHFVRTQAFVDELREEREPAIEGTTPPDPITRISYEDVEFGYDEEPVLDGVSFDVDRGDFVAFVGPSGAGKSTIISLLARLYEPDAGQIRANGTDIREFDLDEWRSELAIVRQQPYIFDDTLEYNLTVGNRDATRSDVERVCEIAQVTEFLDDLPDGFDTTLGDNGVRLSGGQRQRVAIARALLSDADILVFDEATSDLDTSLETAVHESIVSTESDRTLLVVAHRLSTVIDADRIYAMEDGEIEETGAHDELIRQDGTYAELYTAQAQN